MKKLPPLTQRSSMTQRPGITNRNLNLGQIYSESTPQNQDLSRNEFNIYDSKTKSYDFGRKHKASPLIFYPESETKNWLRKHGKERFIDFQDD